MGFLKLPDLESWKAFGGGAVVSVQSCLSAEWEGDEELTRETTETVGQVLFLLYFLYLQ